MPKSSRCNYSPEKNAQLKEIRGISFEEVEFAINDGKVLDIIEHPNKKKYPDQKILVPFVKQGNIIFLKTIFPSRKLTKKYLKRDIE